MSLGKKGLGRAKEGGELSGPLWPWQENLRGQPKLNTVSEKTMCSEICLANKGQGRHLHKQTRAINEECSISILVRHRISHLLLINV